MPGGSHQAPYGQTACGLLLARARQLGTAQETASAAFIETCSVPLPNVAPMPTDATRELYVPLHDGDALGVDGTQVRILEEVHEEGFGGLLQRKDCRALPPQPNGTRT